MQSWPQDDSNNDDAVNAGSAKLGNAWHVTST